MNTTTETRTCLHCARDIEWIEADGQGAWYDSSNRTGCADGETPHAPAPLCGSCDDYGVIEIRHASTDGLIGHRPCDDPLCADRRAKAAARAADCRCRRHPGHRPRRDGVGSRRPGRRRSTSSSIEGWGVRGVVPESPFGSVTAAVLSLIRIWTGSVKPWKSSAWQPTGSSAGAGQGHGFGERPV
jgi:hypothetical protein